MKITDYVRAFMAAIAPPAPKRWTPPVFALPAPVLWTTTVSVTEPSCAFPDGGLSGCDRPSVRASDGDLARMGLLQDWGPWCN